MLIVFVYGRHLGHGRPYNKFDQRGVGTWTTGVSTFILPIVISYTADDNDYCRFTLVYVIFAPLFSYGRNLKNEK